MGKITTILLITFYTAINAQQFTKMENQPPVTDGGDSRSVNWIDYDGDGDLDLFITNGPNPGQNNFLYKNENGTFIKVDDVAVTQDSKSSDGSTWGDYDNDGDPDLFVGNWWNQNNLLYSNNGDGTFTFENEKPSTELSYSETGSWGDFNNDGFLDLYVANSDGDRKNFLYQNNGDGRFTKILDGDVVNDNSFTRSVDWIDYDNDGDLDLYCANEGNTRNSLYQNNGDNTFTKISSLPIALISFNSFSSSWADYDNDGDFDLFISNNGNQNNELYQNNGDGTFLKLNIAPLTTDKGYSVSSAWGDVDNDGDLDLLVTNAFSNNNRTNNFFYLNNGDGTFTKDEGLLSQNNGWTYGAEFGDYNNDGYLDLAAANCFLASENNSIYVNNGGSNNWLKMNLSGTISNKSAIGSVVKIKANIAGTEVLQTRRVAGQSSYCTQNMQLHFGLGDASTIDSVIINWPSGEVSILTDVNANQILNIEETIPENYLSVNFKADVISGPDHTTVNFTDLSISDPNNPITSWQWDLDNNGSKESDLQNTAYTYSSQSETYFSVKLTVSTATQTLTKIRENYIHITGVTSVKDLLLGNSFMLQQNYPNPFNPVTTISYSIPYSQANNFVSLKVYDVLGNEVSTLVDGNKEAGFHSIKFDASNLSSGLYFYILKVGNKIDTKKMLLLK